MRRRFMVGYVVITTFLMSMLWLMRLGFIRLSPENLSHSLFVVFLSNLGAILYGGLGYAWYVMNKAKVPVLTRLALTFAGLLLPMIVVPLVVSKYYHRIPM